MTQSRKLLLVLAALVGAAIVSVAFAADASALAGAVQIDTRIDLGTLIGTTLTILGGLAVGITLWVKINRESATHQAQINLILSRLDRTDDAVSTVHQRMDAFLLSVSTTQQGRG